MLSAEIKINGSLLGHLYLHNLGYLKGKLTECEYEYEYYEIGKKIIKGNVIHDRQDGAIKLLEIATTDITSKKVKK